MSHPDPLRPAELRSHGQAACEVLWGEERQGAGVLLLEAGVMRPHFTEETMGDICLQSHSQYACVGIRALITGYALLPVSPYSLRYL